MVLKIKRERQTAFARRLKLRTQQLSGPMELDSDSDDTAKRARLEPARSSLPDHTSQVQAHDLDADDEDVFGHGREPISEE